MPSTGPEVFLVRHGETEWSATRRHTGSTDVPLTEAGRREAEGVRADLAGGEFVRVLTSPSSRAVETCRIAGLADRAEVRDDLHEWDYGQYEGMTTAEIRSRRPDWSLWRDGCPGGESPAQVGARADRVVAELRGLDGNAALFGHGHFLRVLTARWLALPPDRGSSFGLDTAAVGVLGWERENPAIWLWNRTAAAG